MQHIAVNAEILTEGASLLVWDDNSCSLQLSKDGAGMVIPQLAACTEHLLTFYAEVLEDHSLPMHLLVYAEDRPALEIRFGLLPRVRTMVCIDLNWLDAGELFPEAMPGTLKIVCHGRRVDRNEVSRFVLSSLPMFHDVKIKIDGMRLTDEYPAFAELPDGRLVDVFGQNKQKTWRNKVEDLDDLKDKLQKQYKVRGVRYPFADWTIYGGWKKKKLREGIGYFTSCKERNRWWLVDPLGYAFFSMGPDCVNLGDDCRVDGVEKWLDWLPDRRDPEYGKFFHSSDRMGKHRMPLFFSYTKANLYKVFGKDWYEKWQVMICSQLQKYGMNTLGNWSDPRLLGHIPIPYVTSLPEFPATRQCIFRDFPDVFNEEYTVQAQRCAQALEAKKSDTLMIGYFLRNEPMWAFVDNLVLADEVLYNPVRTACKEKLIEFLRERYQRIDCLNESWKSSYTNFEDLYSPQKDVSKQSVVS